MPTMTEYSHGQFSWVDLMTSNVDDSCSFYQDLFGWSVITQDTQGGPPYAIFQLGGKDVAGLGQMSPDLISQEVPAAWNSYINVDNLEVVLDRVTEIGGTVMLPMMPVMNAGWMAGIQDPTGARVFLWQKRDHAGAGLVNDPGSFCWNELATRNIEGACEFYGSLLGWEFERNDHSPHPYFVIKIHGRDNGGIIQMDEQWGPMPPVWNVYFTVTNVEASVALLTSLKGKVIVPIFDVPVGRMAVVSDRQGACFNLFELGENAVLPG